MAIIPRRWALRAATALACAAGIPAASAQTPAADPSTRLRAVLPPDVADHVLAQIADARARQLPPPRSSIAPPSWRQRVLRRG